MAEPEFQKEIAAIVLIRETHEAQCKIESGTWKMALIKFQQGQAALKEGNMSQAQYFFRESVRLYDSIQWECLTDAQKQKKDKFSRELKEIMQEIKDLWYN